MDNPVKDEAKQETMDSRNRGLRYEWRTFFSTVLKPITILPILLTVYCLYLSNTTHDNKNFSILLNIIASISLTIACNFIYEAYRAFREDTILIKKGMSAVRNLSLARIKIKSIAGRVKEKAAAEEITTHLDLLEKDIANATQEWHDIIPTGVNKIEMIYLQLEQTERELERAKNETELLETKLKETTEGAQNERVKLEQEIDQKKKEIFELSQQKNRLQSSTASSVVASGYSGYSGPQGWSVADMLRSGDAGATPFLICSKCGSQFQQTNAFSDSTLCYKCRNK